MKTPQTIAPTTSLFSAESVTCEQTEGLNNSANSLSLISPRRWPPVGVKSYYSDDSVCIILGDCREILPTLEPVDLVLTDPQWGVNLTEKAHKEKTYFYGDCGYSSTEDSPEYVKAVCVPVISQARELFSRVVVLPGTRCAFFYPCPMKSGRSINPRVLVLVNGDLFAQHLFYFMVPTLI